MSKKKQNISKKQNTSKTIVVMILFAIIAIAIYYKLSDSTSPFGSKKETEMTEAQTLIAKDLEGNYPATPRAVLKLYERIVKCIQNDALKEGEIEELAQQMRNLLDEEFLVSNPYEVQLEKLKLEKDAFKKSNSSIMNYNVAESELVTYWNYQEKEMSSVLVNYTLKQSSTYVKITEKFILRKDAENRWKILGWETVEQVVQE